MTQAIRNTTWGLCPQTPGIYRFFGPEWQLTRGQHSPPDAFPAAEPVARVASQHCLIPSDSGTLSMQKAGAASYKFAANGNLSNSDLSHEPIHPRIACPTEKVAYYESPAVISLTEI